MTPNKQVGIIVVAIGLDAHVRQTFELSLAESHPQCSYELELVMQEPQVSWPRKFRDIHPALHEARYRLSAALRGFTPRLYNKSRCLNRAIRKLAHSCEVIVCTDIDMWIPPGLVDRTYELARHGTHVWCPCRHIAEDKINDPNVLLLPCSESGKGSWNAMSIEDWFHSGGWNENMYGWGTEDDAMHHYIQLAGITTTKITDLPLLHVDHERRPSFFNAHYNLTQINNRRGLLVRQGTGSLFSL